MKKLLSYLLVIALVLVQFTPLVSAADMDGVNAGSTPKTKGSILISNALKDKTYSIYQILELESFDDERNAYTYNAVAAWNGFLNGSDVKDVYLSYDEIKGIWTWLKTTDADAQAFAQLALAYAEANSIRATASQKADADGEISFKEIPLGYYVVDSTAGALCSLTTTHADAKVVEKNKLPGVDKTVEEDSNPGFYGDSNTADMNQVVNFKTTINVEAGAENYVLVDVMSKGLTLDTTSFVLTHADGTVVSADAYDIYTSGDKLSVNHGGTNATATFVIEFDNEYMAGLTDNAETTNVDERDIIVAYKATVNKDAVVESTGNPNETWLEYGDENETVKDTTITYTLSFDVTKTNAQGDTLTGAEFELHTYATENSPISFVELTDDEGNVIGYRKATDADTVTTTIIKIGSANIEGLDAATYYLEETKAPEGYNKLTSRIKVVVGTTMDGTTINAVVDGDYESQIVTYGKTTDDVIIKNFTGALLPSTGGMGTVLFVTIGSIMVMGFGVLLVTKLRMSKMTI